MPHLEPTGIELSDSRGLFCVSWEGTETTQVPYRALRLACRCATCIDEITGKPLLDPSTVPEDVGITEVEQVGLYGVRFFFNDTATTEIYTWERIRELSPL